MPYAEVEPDVVKARIARGEDVFLLDVREPDEVEAWAYPIGVHIPLGELGNRLDELPRIARSWWPATSGVARLPRRRP